MILCVDNRQDKVKIDRRRVRSTLTRLLNRLDLQNGELSLVLMDDAGIREMNRRYLNRDRATNVLSFAMAEGEFGNVTPNLLGDIVVSVEKAQEASRAGDIPFDDALDYLIIHGLLQLLGYDHESGDPRETARMARKEMDLFFTLKGYAIDVNNG